MTTIVPDLDQLLTDFDVMRLLQVSRSTVRRMRTQGQLPHVTIGRLIRYPHDAVRQITIHGSGSTRRS